MEMPQPDIVKNIWAVLYSEDSCSLFSAFWDSYTKLSIPNQSMENATAGRNVAAVFAAVAQRYSIGSQQVPSLL